jgi:hypothetical protein
MLQRVQMVNILLGYFLHFEDLYTVLLSSTRVREASFVQASSIYAINVVSSPIDAFDESNGLSCRRCSQATPSRTRPVEMRTYVSVRP